MIIEDGTIGGHPVFIADSNKIANGNVNAGCFAYCMVNQHGDSSLVVDPYTKAKKNAIQITLNEDWSVTTLKYEAFCVGTANPS